MDRSTIDQRTEPLRVFRNRTRWPLALLSWVCFSAALYGLAYGEQGGVQLTLALVGILLTAELVLVFRAGVAVTTKGITIQRYTGRDAHISWPLIRAFTIRHNPRGDVVVVELTDGRAIVCEGLLSIRANSPWTNAVLGELENFRRSM